jgi:hypothetical protein
VFYQNSAVGNLNQSNCSHPFHGFLVLRAPYFSDASDHNIGELNNNLTNRLKTCSTPNNVFVGNYSFDANTYLWVQISICPVVESYFNRSVIINCFDLNSQDYALPKQYGPYYFSPFPYDMSSTGIPYFINL